MGEVDREGRRVRRLTPDTMTPEQRAAYERRRAERETPEYQEGLRRDIEAYQREYPPAAVGPEILDVLLSLRAAREARGLSLTDVMEQTGIDRATISKLETGKVANPTYRTVSALARAVGKRVVWTLEDADVEG